MVLVPFESEDSVPKAPVSVGDFSLMDRDMDEILKNKTLSEDDKWIKYNQILQRYMSKLQRTKRDISEAFQYSDDEDDESVLSKISKPDNTPQPPNMNELLDRVHQTKAQRKRSEKLYHLLSKCSNISWNTQGETKIGTKKAGNIEELIYQCMTSNPRSNIDGWNGFTEFLKSVNIPISYVNNIELKNFLRDDKSSAVNSSKKNTKTRTPDAPKKWIAFS